MIEPKTNGIISKEMLAHLTDPDLYVVKPSSIPRQPGFLISANDVMAGNTTEIPFLLEGVLQRTGLACLAGSSDTGKSCLLRQLAIAVAARAGTFIGFRLNSVHHRAIFVSTEDGKEATGYLLKKQSLGYGLPTLDDLYFAFSYEGLYDEISRSLQQQPVDVVVIDCFQDAYGNDLKDSQQIRLFLNRFQELAEQHQCLFLFLHHTGKRTENMEPSKNNLLSGQGLEAKMRLVIELRTDLMNPLLRHLCIVKGNYLSAESKRESYVLEFDESSFTFTNTGERVHFDKLMKKDESAQNDKDKEKYLQARGLKEQGMSYEKIAERMGICSTSVFRIFRKAKERNWDQDGIIMDEEEIRD